MGKDFGKTLLIRLIIKVVIPLVLGLIILFAFFANPDLDMYNSNNYNFNPEEISTNITAVGIEEFKASLNSRSDSIFFFCSNEEKRCYQMLVDLKDFNVNVEYLNVLELTDIEKEELKKTDLFDDELYPRLIIIKNKTIKVYNTFISKEGLNKII